MYPYSFLFKKDRPFRIEFNCNKKNQPKRYKQYNCRSGKYNVYQPFEKMPVHIPSCDVEKVIADDKCCGYDKKLPENFSGVLERIPKEFSVCFTDFNTVIRLYHLYNNMSRNIYLDIIYKYISVYLAFYLINPRLVTAKFSTLLLDPIVLQFTLTTQKRLGIIILLKGNGMVYYLHENIVKDYRKNIEKYEKICRYFTEFLKKKTVKRGIAPRFIFNKKRTNV